MERLLVVLFENQQNASDGSHALAQLDRDASIALYAAAVVAKNADGTTTVIDSSDSGPWVTLAGTPVGSVIRLLGGPLGLSIAAPTPALIEAIADLDNARVGTDFLEDVGEAFALGTLAVVAQIDEEWTTPIDIAMESLGGYVFRRTLGKFVDAHHNRDLAVLRLDLAQSKAEHDAAPVERKGKLKANIDSLSAKLRQMLQQSKARRDALRHEAEAKLKWLQTKAAQSRNGIKAKRERRLDAARKEYGHLLKAKRSG